MVETDNFLPIIMLILLLVTVACIFLFNFDVMQPSVILSIVMTLSLLLGTLNIQKWNLFVGSNTALVFLTGIFAFVGGGIFAHYNYSKKSIENCLCYKNYFISIPFILIFTLLVLLLAFMSGMEMYNMSVALGNHEGVMNIIKTIRYPLERGEVEFSRWMSYRNIISMSIATVFLYLYIYQVLFGHESRKKTLLYLLPVIAVVPFFVLSTGRRSIVHFILTACVIACIFYQQKNGYNHFVRLKMLKLLIIAGIVSLLCYFLMGFLTGKVSIGGRDPFTIIAHYGGLSVPALDQFLNGILLENKYIGQNTLMSFYGNLNTLGFHLEKGKSFLPFVQFQGTDFITTNVYTVLYRLIADWSYPGMLLIMFIFGAFLTLWYDHLKYHTSPLSLVVYAHFAYIPFFLLIDDQFMTMLSTQTLYFTGLCTILLWLAEKKNVLKAEQKIISNYEK